PYAVIHRGLGAVGLGELVVFSIAVFVSFVYLIANGALDWGPIKRRQGRDEMVSAARTSTSTIRRVGLEGRSPRDEAA
ncbi:MAG: NADH-ubiquinone/plastoquinone oxidoreductase chain 3, partial [Acidimicrobiales bacterium]